MNAREIIQDSATALHHQVYVVLLQQIIDSDFGPTGKMPTESQLSEIYKVSRITIRKALDRLEAEGHVERLRSKGTFALQVESRKPIQTNVSVVDNLAALGIETTIKVIDFRDIAPPKDVAAKLEMPEYELVQRTVRVRSHKRQPFCSMTSYVPTRLGASYTSKDLLSQPLLCLIEKANIRLGAAEQTISAKLADPRSAGLLGVDIGAALLYVQRLVRDSDSRPIEFMQALYRPDNYEYHMTVPHDAGVQSDVWHPAHEL